MVNEIRVTADGIEQDRDHGSALSGGAGAGRYEQDRDHGSALSGGAGADRCAQDRDHGSPLSGGAGTARCEQDRDHGSALSGGAGAGRYEQDRDHGSALRASGPIAVETIAAEPPLLDLRDEWTALLARSDADNVFLTWEWCSTWWRHLGH